jgi:TorA maturation chaperone TorD
MPADPEMFRALGALCERPDPAHAGIAAALRLPVPPGGAAFTEVFVFQLVPFAAPYLSPDGMLGGEAADRVAGFWRALSLTPPAEPDHLAALLGLYAALMEQEQAEQEPARQRALRSARRALLWEHLLTWVPPYTQAIITLSSRFHTAWARLLGEALLHEAQSLGRPATPPLHLRDIPDLPGIASEAFARAVLAPARSGLLITRHDLAGAAAATGTGARIGGRAFILGALISQDRAATFRWLARQAAQWAARHRAGDPPLAGIAPHWYGKAEATRRLLRQTLLEAA